MLCSYMKTREEKSTAQIAVLTVKTAGDYSIEEYALEVFEKWKPGQKGKDNGVLLVVAVEDRAVKIEVGYGLEGVLTDTKCGLIIRNFILPEFRQNNYSGGIESAVKMLGSYLDGDEESVAQLKALEEKRDADESDIGALIPFICWIIFILIIVISNIKGGKGGGGGHSGGGFTGGGFGGGFNGRYGGGGFGGGHGGFGGGGGGRSGGGGASGRW